MAVQIQLRNDTAANWTSENPTLAVGEIGIESDTLSVKVGDGSTEWISLDYFGVSSTYVDSAVAGIVDSAPGALDTLNELAAALGDDENFATTVTNALAGKAATSHTHAISDVTNLQTTLDSKAPLAPSVNAKTGAYTLASTDRGEYITCDGTFTITIPSGTFNAGDSVTFVNVGTGIITFTGSGVTVNSVDAAVTIDTQWAGATVLFTSSTTAVLIGKLA